MNCKTCKNLLIEALYEELDTSQQQDFEAHLAACGKCTAAFREMQATLQIMAKRERAVPDAAYWDGFWARLAPELQKTPGNRNKGSRSWLGWLPEFNFSPQWIYGLSGAAALLIIGILIGKVYFSAPSPLPQLFDASSTREAKVQFTEMQQRSQRYLERSKVLLLGLVNYEPVENDATPLNMSYRKQLSHELVREAAILQEGLADARQQRLRKLIADIEMILVQIANMEEMEDLPAVELIRSSVDRKGILLKINLEEMKTEGQACDLPRHGTKNRKL